MFLWFFAFVGFITVLFLVASAVFVGIDQKRRQNFFTALSVARALSAPKKPAKKAPAVEVAICTFDDTTAWMNVTKLVTANKPFDAIFAEAAHGRPRPATIYINTGKDIWFIQPNDRVLKMATPEESTKLQETYPVLSLPTDSESE